MDYATYFAQSPRLKKPHIKCRGEKYQRGGIPRTQVKDEDLGWNKDLQDYEPRIFTADSVRKDKTGNKPFWADYDIGDENLNKASWNDYDKLDGSKIDRRSYECKYKLGFIHSTQVPLNPRGRTGLRGRGALGRWGPNHAADPIVTRWQPGGENILEFIAIKRRDTGEWAIPGGMVDPDEHVNLTLRREFGEEAMASLEVSDKDRKRIQQNVDELFRKGGDLVI